MTGKWRENIRKVVPYVPGEQPNIAGMIKLNTNENPYPPSREVTKACEGFQTDVLRLYPDPTIKGLVSVLADYHKVTEDRVFVGVGSDDVLATAFMSLFAGEKPILFPDITYSFYDVWADLFRIPYRTLPLDADFRIVKEDYFTENGGIVIANPNAPTGIYENTDFLREIVQRNPDSVVIIDEAYADFAPGTALALTAEYDNVLVVRTFSKSRSMAGMRIGYAIGSPELIRAMNDVKYSYNSYTMNQTSITFGKASVLDDAYFKETVQKIVNTREYAKKRLADLGFTFPDSQTNFLFVTHKEIPAERIFNSLKEEHIYVRYFNKDRINNYLRITMGTDAEMERVYESLERIIERESAG